MKVIPAKLEGVLLIEPAIHGDHRGFFMESYNKQKFAEAGIHYEFVQDNHSLSRETGTLRGLHYQLAPYAQTKLVRVLHGSILDVVVDIRKQSPTFGEWESFVLSAENKRQLLVPAGFAHGFCTLEPDTQVFYKVDQFYHPAADRGIAWNDPKLGIAWPTDKPMLSEKDGRHPVLEQAEINF